MTWELKIKVDFLIRIDYTIKITDFFMEGKMTSIITIAITTTKKTIGAKAVVGTGVLLL